MGTCYFDWDDTEAAYKFRVEQATKLLRAFRKVMYGKNKTREIRAFHPIIVMENEALIPACGLVMEIFSNDDYRCQVIRKAWDELTKWQLKYKEYKELEEVFIAIENTEKSLMADESN